MKVAVVSDIHDNIWNLESALELIRAEKPGTLFFLGDLCAPFTMKQIAEGVSCPIHAVFGNNDGDEFLIQKVSSGFPHVTLHGYLAELEIGGRAVALNHYPDISKRLAESGAYDAVFSGHDHKRYVHTVGKTLWANPGEVMGRFGEPGFGIYDSDSNRFRHIDIQAART